MCPLYPFHLILLYLCLLLPLLLAVVEGSEVLADFKNWNLTFSPSKVTKLQQFNTSQVKVPEHLRSTIGGKSTTLFPFAVTTTLLNV
jgi:hypothetical protein